MKTENMLLSPFKAIWRLITFIFELTGRFVAFILGLVFLIIGVFLTATVIGALIGIPFIVVGLLLMIRSIF